MACPVWLSIGHSVGAAIGVAVASERRVLVLCGDGGFQMTAQSLSTLSSQGGRAVVIVIDNGLYAIEQYLIDPEYFHNEDASSLPYVGLNRWQYSDLAKAMGFTNVGTANTKGELQALLDAAGSWETPGFITARVISRDLPPENQ